MQGKQLEEIPVFLESATNSTRSPDSNVIGIRTSEFKYFRDRDDSTKNIHLYDLREDPLEENNIAETNIVTNGLLLSNHFLLICILYHKKHAKYN